METLYSYSTEEDAAWLITFNKELRNDIYELIPEKKVFPKIKNQD